ncbi:MAG: metallophosphoesterase [Luteolibacter sp.]|uniref:metallophosphoesterase n=1 Tax=Luteolibacter sp. TaxID=1962973 RepID=UPI0032662D7B
MENPDDCELTEKPARFSRRKAIGLITAGVAGCLFDAFEIEPACLSITREDIFYGPHSPGLDGLRIGLLSDFHFRPDADHDLLFSVVSKIHEQRLDLIALAGDFMSADPRVIDPLLSHLKRINPAHGVFAVLGNHDGWAGNRSTIRRQFEKAGLSFLVNQHSKISIGSESLAIAGTDYVWLGKPDPARTLKGIAAGTPILALVHEPDYFDTMIGHRDILLQVSGHTHGGQCRIPFVGYAPRKVAYGRKYVYGRYSSGNSNLFVSRGVGTVGPRVRFACPPELAILTLRSGPVKNCES